MKHETCLIRCWQCPRAPKVISFGDFMRASLLVFIVTIASCLALARHSGLTPAFADKVSIHGSLRETADGRTFQPYPSARGGERLQSGKPLQSQGAGADATPGTFVILPVRTPNAVTTGAGGPPLIILATRAARECRVDPGLFVSLIMAESRFDVDAVSPTGARGLGQVFPRTARAVSHRFDGLTLNIDVPRQNLRVAACYLHEMIERFGVERGLHAYHDGPGAISRGRPSAQARVHARRVLSRLPLTKLAQYAPQQKERTQ